MKFEEGKEVRIIADSIGHGFKIGSIITMGELFNDNSFEAKELVNGRLYFVPFSDCEEIEKKPFGKQDLKTGMLVQFRDGDVYMFINDTFVSDEGWLSLDGFDKDLNYAYDDEYDIMKVSKVFEGYLLMPKNWNEKTLNNNLLWEREETKKMTVSEIQKELGYKIEIIE